MNRLYDSFVKNEDTNSHSHSVPSSSDASEEKKRIERAKKAQEDAGSGGGITKRTNRIYHIVRARRSKAGAEAKASACKQAIVALSTGRKRSTSDCGPRENKRSAVNANWKETGKVIVSKDLSRLALQWLGIDNELGYKLRR